MTEQQSKTIWLAVREAALLIAATIGRMFGLEKKCPHCGKPVDKHSRV